MNLLNAIKNSQELTLFLMGQPIEFDVTTLDTDEDWLRFEPETPFTLIASDMCGGSWVSVGRSSDWTDPIFHVSSEGEAGLVGANLKEALENLLSVPFWDAHKRLDVPEMREECETDLQDLIAREPSWLKERDKVTKELGLDLQESHLERLRDSLVRGTKTKVLIYDEPANDPFW